MTFKYHVICPTYADKEKEKIIVSGEKKGIDLWRGTDLGEGNWRMKNI